MSYPNRWSSVRVHPNAVNILAVARLRRARGTFAERGLRGGEPRDRHAVRRAGHVIEPDLVTERDRCGIAAMLAAHAELQPVAHLAAATGRDADEVAQAGGGGRE